MKTNFVVTNVEIRNILVLLVEKSALSGVMLISGYFFQISPLFTIHLKQPKQLFKVFHFSQLTY